MSKQTLTHYLSIGLITIAAACGQSAPDGPQPKNPGGKGDTGWIADSSFEVGGWIESTLTTAGRWPDTELATDAKQQQQVVDEQVKYAKKTMEKSGYILNQLPERVEVQSVTQDETTKLVTIHYRARVDLIKPGDGTEPPQLDTLTKKEFVVPLPRDPVFVFARGGETCAEDWGSYTLAEHKYYYYFAPDKEGCEDKVVLEPATLVIDTVYPVKTVYPEYDKLLRPLDEHGTVGFTAAIMPTDDNGMLQFDDHKRMITMLVGREVEGVRVLEGAALRYRWEKDGATALIDLFDPSVGSFWSGYRSALKEYDVVYYDGHSNYGTYHMVDDPADFHDRYQILMVDSCRSYAYYMRQVFASKGGFANADVVGTGESNPFWVASRVMGHLVRNLMNGIAAVSRGESHQAPSWQDITEDMNVSAYDVYYGAAGVRDNAWQPEQPTE